MTPTVCSVTLNALSVSPSPRSIPRISSDAVGDPGVSTTAAYLYHRIRELRAERRALLQQLGRDRLDRVAAGLGADGVVDPRVVAVVGRAERDRRETAVTELAETVPIDVCPPSKEDGRACDVLAGGKDITWETRSPEVEAYVSPVSAYQGVRKALASQQRRIGLRGRVVMVGRDIGTVVLPEAQLKIYLVASPEERARRRYKEILDRGGQADYDTILAGVQRRDEIDSHRAFSPLKAAADAIIVDSDRLTADQVFVEVEKLCR